MNFDNFDGIDIVDKISLLRNCKSAERNIMISPYNAIANSRKSYLLDVHYPSNVLAESDREYIAYSVYSDSKLLSEIDHPKFTEREIVQIAIDLTNILIELQSIGQGISLRNIQAGNVIVTPCEGGYMAGIVNMETAKIQGYNATVYKSIESSFSENPYMPREVRQGNESENIQWEKKPKHV